MDKGKNVESGVVQSVAFSSSVGSARGEPVALMDAMTISFLFLKAGVAQW